MCRLKVCFILIGHLWYVRRIFLRLLFIPVGKIYPPVFPSSLPHPLPTLLLAPFFARSLTLVPHSLLLNRTETLVSQANHPKIKLVCVLSYLLEAEFLTTGTQRYSQTSINRTPVHPQRFWRLIGEVAVTEWDNKKTTGFYFTWCASLKTAGNVSCRNIIFQVCFLAIAISFLDNYPNSFLRFITGAFLKIVKKC